MKERIYNDIVKAMKDGREEERDILIFILAQIKQKENDNHVELSDDGVVNIIRKNLRQTAEASAVRETEELARRKELLMKYMPNTLSEGELYSIVSKYKVNEPDVKKALPAIMSKYSNLVADRAVLVNMIKKIYS